MGWLGRLPLSDVPQGGLKEAHADRAEDWEGGGGANLEEVDDDK